MMNFEISRVYREIIEEVSRAIEEDTENIGLSRDQIQDLKMCWGRKLREMTTPKEPQVPYQFRSIGESFRSPSSSSIFGYKNSFDGRALSYDGRKNGINNMKYQQNGIQRNDRGEESSEYISYDEKNGSGGDSFFKNDYRRQSDSDISSISRKDDGSESVFDNDSIDGDISDEIYSDSENEEDSRIEQENKNFMMCLYVKVDKNKFKWRVKLKQGFINIGESEYVFNTAQGDLTWG